MIEATKNPRLQPGADTSPTLRFNFMNSEMKLEIILLTPDMATEFLRNNDGNRRLDDKRVDKITADILSNKFVLTPDAIQISPDGRLLNGQTRSSACVKANRPIPVVLASQVPEDIFPLIDGGRPRALAFRAKISQKESEVATLLLRLGMDQSRALIDVTVLNQVATAIKPWMGLLREIAPNNIRIFTAAPGRLAAVVSMINDGDPVYTLSLLRNLTLHRIAELPPVGNSLVQQKMSGTGFLKGGGAEVQKTNFCRMRFGLNPINRYKQKLIVNESMQQQAISDARTLVTTILSGRPVIPTAPIPTLADFA